jgi:uncharacterized membrane protein YphA (DoxX/SURF4 family)
LDKETALNVTEALLRAILGWRFLVSGVSNIRRWPNPVRTASILFPHGATFFGLAATVLMVVGGAGVSVGFQTRTCAIMLLIFLLPTFALHLHWLKVLPTLAPTVTDGINNGKAREIFRIFERQAYHAHEVGIRDNLVLLAAAVYFALRGGGAFAVDHWLTGWFIRPF